MNHAEILRSALDNAALWAQLSTHRLSLFLDYDGTLTPIVERPEQALLDPSVRDVLRELAKKIPVAIVSGRDRNDVERLVGLSGIAFAGCHGFDIRDASGCLPELPLPPGMETRIGEIAAWLRRSLGATPGVEVEAKRYAVVVHVRRAEERIIPEVRAVVDQAVAEHPGVKRSGGKKIFEILPNVPWDKGHAVSFLLETADDASNRLPVYIGDDVTDEDGFRAVADQGVGILVSDAPRDTQASYRLKDPDEVHRFLQRLSGIIV